MKTISPKAFLFDLDGTLIDTELIWSRAIANYIQEQGINVTLEEVQKIVFGRSWFDIHKTIFTRFPQLPQLSVGDAAIALRSYYNKLVENPETLVIKTNVEFFNKVSQFVPCVIVSGSPHKDVEIAAQLCGISDKLVFVFGSEDYENGKPAPDGYLAAAKKLGVKPQDCIVVEDSTAGVKSGVAAGMRVVGIDNNKLIKQDLSLATWRVADLSEIDIDATFGFVSCK